MPLRWKGGITNDKKYLFGIMVEKVLTTVKNYIKRADTSSKSISPYVSDPTSETHSCEYSEERGI